MASKRPSETETKLGKSTFIQSYKYSFNIYIKNYIFEAIGWNWQLSSKITT